MVFYYYSANFSYRLATVVILFIFQVCLTIGRVIVIDNNGSSAEHKVAFKCGYRSKFINQNGTWVTDIDKNAACLRGKLDILKYCRKIYPQVNITNVAELDDFVKIEKWCPLGIRDSSSYSCDFKFDVRPFLCLGSDLKSRLGDIPDDCQFDQSEDRTKCESFRYWKEKASRNCDIAFQNDNVSGQVVTCNVMQPCGLDLFTSYEYLCCPKRIVGSKIATKIFSSAATTITTLSSRDNNNSNEDDDEENESIEDVDDGSYDDDDNAEVVTIDASKVINKKRNGQAVKSQGANDVDEYYRKADLVNEHANYRDALTRLQRTHKSKISKVMTEWDKLEQKYKTLNETDPERAGVFRQQMIERYQSTIKNVVAATKTERYKLSDVHERRLLAEFHEKFRTADDQFVQMLKKRQVKNNRVGALSGNDADIPTSSEILRSIQKLIKLVEKYRVRTFNHYRHWLKTDNKVRANALKRPILARLLANDVLLNRSFDALDVNLPTNLANKIKPIAIEWWQTFREEQAVDVDNDEILWLGDSSNTEKLMSFYENLQNQADSSGWRYNDYSIMLNHSTTTTTPSVHDSVGTTTTNYLSSDDVKNRKEFDGTLVASPSLLLKNRVQQQNMFIENRHYGGEIVGENRRYISYWLFAVGGLALLTVTVVAVSVVKRKIPHSHATFVQVDNCNPEERHVSTMQVNGYVNPTYKYFEQS